MLRLTLEIVPFGDESRKRTIGRLEIANDATGDVETGNYNAILHADNFPVEEPF